MWHIYTMPQNKFIPLENCLNNNLYYDEIKNCLEKALSFYGDYCKQLLLSSGTTVFLNDKKEHRALGSFSHFDNSITMHQIKNSLEQNVLDCVFVHELAHFLDHERRNRYSRYNFASSQRGSEERVIAEIFRMKMSPVPKKRTNYRGRTRELFARAIEEFYAVQSENRDWFNLHFNNFYVNEATFRKDVYPVVCGYIAKIQKEK